MRPSRAHHEGMSEDDKPEKPDPIEDVRKGLGLLFRAAKSAIDQLPTRHVEDVVVAGAREVGRAIENVTSSLDKQFFKRDAASKNEAKAGEAPVEPGVAAESPQKPESPSEETPKGPRVG
jgi:hypothetical protein